MIFNHKLALRNHPLASFRGSLPQGDDRRISRACEIWHAPEIPRSAQDDSIIYIIFCYLRNITHNLK